MNVLEEYFRENGDVAIHDVYITLNDILHHSFTSIINRRKEAGVKTLFGKICEVLEPVKGKTVLDVGCGIGYFTFLLAEAGAVVTGIERDPTLYTVAEHIRTVKGLNCGFVNSPIHEHIKKSYGYDAVLMLNVFDQMLRKNEDEAWETLRLIRHKSKQVFMMTGATEQLPNCPGQRTSQPFSIPLMPQFESWEMGYEMIMRKGEFKDCKLLLRNNYAQRDLWVFF